MYELYGTFLIHTIEKRIREEGPLTLREIVEKIAPQLEGSPREQSNLYHRVRRATLYLVDQDMARRSWEISSNNIPIQKFSVYERITDDQADAEDGIRAMEQLAEQLLPMAEPMLQQLFEKYNRPKEEGGLLEADDYGVGFSIMPMQKESEWTFVYLIVVYAYDAESGRMYISQKKPVTELVNDQGNG